MGSMAPFENMDQGAWVAQWVKCPTLAQVMISRFMSSSPTLGPSLTVWSLLGILSLLLSAPHLLMYLLSLSLSK